MENCSICQTDGVAYKINLNLSAGLACPDQLLETSLTQLTMNPQFHNFAVIQVTFFRFFTDEYG